MRETEQLLTFQVQGISMTPQRTSLPVKEHFCAWAGSILTDAWRRMVPQPIYTHFIFQEISTHFTPFLQRKDAAVLANHSLPSAGAGTLPRGGCLSPEVLRAPFRFTLQQAWVAEAPNRLKHLGPLQSSQNTHEE